jgi:hypothetical protein
MDLDSGFPDWQAKCGQSLRVGDYATGDQDGASPYQIQSRAIATAIAGAYMNIPVAHTQGGEVSGSIDESVRHAITKLSHIHFPATELSARRIIAMGEDPRYVFNVGCPSIDLAARIHPGTHRDALINHCGTGSPIDSSQPFLLVMQHGVTTEYGHGLTQMTATLRAVSSIGMQALVFWPNVDAGSAEVAAGPCGLARCGVAERNTVVVVSAIGSDGVELGDAIAFWRQSER